MNDKEFANELNRLTYFPRKEKSMFSKFFSNMFSKARLVTENMVSDITDVACSFVDIMVRFVSDSITTVVESVRSIGLVGILAFIILAFTLSGCAHDGYYVHLWCKTTKKDFSFGIYTQDDGKLMVKVYDADLGCSYVKDHNVVIQNENHTVK